MKYIFYPFALSFLVCLMISCSKDEVNPEDGNKESTLNKKMNQFIQTAMEDVYLWTDKIQGRHIDLNIEPKDFLEKMKYEKEDQWSFLEEEEVSTKSIISGTETSQGYEIIFYQLSEKDDIVVGMIRYVHPNSPAAEAGLKRGDMIVQNNEEWLTSKTYSKIKDDATVKVRLGTVTHDGVLYAFDEVYELTNREVEIQPILLDTILEVEGKKIGYLVYTEFIDNQKNSLSDLDNAFAYFKQEQIDEFVLDLRYNQGGNESATQHLASLLAPEEAVINEEVIMKYTWNASYQEKFKNYSNRMALRFDKNAWKYNLNLSRIYILTGDWTASASEALISGLRPYISDMTLIGETTVGKYVGMTQTISKDDELKKWTLWPVTHSFTNKTGESVKGGLKPDVNEYEFSNYLPPFGEYKEDRLLRKAVELITGVIITPPEPTSKSTVAPTLIPLKSTPKRQGFFLLK